MTKERAYKILEIPQTASIDDVKKAFKNLAIKWHPDKNPDNPKAAEEKFKEILAAKDYILNPPVEPAPHEYESGESSIFEQMYREMQENFHGRMNRGEDLHHTVDITLEEAVAGCEKRFFVQRFISCEDCKGRGGSGEKPCDYCEGAGKRTQRNGFVEIFQQCIVCRGRGSQVEKKCSKCTGSGRIPRQESVNLVLKPATDDGFTLVKRFHGHVGRDGSRNGDFYLHVHVLPHTKFTRHGEDLVLTWPLSFAVAALGGQIEVPTLLAGNVKLTIPPGTQPGTVLNLKGKGVTPQGSQLVGVAITIPQNMTEKQKSLLREFIKEG